MRLSPRQVWLSKREREQRMARIERQVAEGTLVIRPMSSEERERWGLPPAPPLEGEPDAAEQ